MPIQWGTGQGRQVCGTSRMSTRLDSPLGPNARTHQTKKGLMAQSFIIIIIPACQMALVPTCLVKGMSTRLGRGANGGLYSHGGTSRGLIQATNTTTTTRAHSTQLTGLGCGAHGKPSSSGNTLLGDWLAIGTIGQAQAPPYWTKGLPGEWGCLEGWWNCWGWMLENLKVRYPIRRFPRACRHSLVLPQPLPGLNATLMPLRARRK